MEIICIFCNTPSEAAIAYSRAKVGTSIFSDGRFFGSREPGDALIDQRLCEQYQRWLNDEAK